MTEQDDGRLVITCDLPSRTFQNIWYKTYPWALALVCLLAVGLLTSMIWWGETVPFLCNLSIWLPDHRPGKKCSIITTACFHSHRLCLFRRNSRPVLVQKYIDMQKRLKGPAESGVASIVVVHVEGFEGECGLAHRALLTTDLPVWYRPMSYN